MKRRILLLSFLLSVILLCTTNCSAQKQYTYIDLIQRLTDLEHPATLPEVGEVCRQWSSYDRKSRYDDKTGKYVNWNANGDGFGGAGWIRKEADKLVLAEIEGPGCIWRTWSATPKNGHMRIYLDGSDKPAVDLPFIDYFSGKREPFNRPALVHIVGSGKNCYVPIPFQKSCKIMADPDYGEFHHFTYSLFPKGTVVPTFKMDLSTEEKTALDNANDFLTNCGPESHGKHAGLEKIDRKLTVPAGSNIIIAELEGPKAIVSLQAKVKLPDDIEQQRRILRELALQITWDDEKSPAVWCPLGDFFGTGPGINYYSSLPLGMTKEGFYCNWYMPFSSAAKVELINDGKAQQKVTFVIKHAPLKKSAESYGRFHVKWHRDAFLPTEKERWIDWTMLKTQGRGRFCGVQLEVWNPRGGWWGEGDEKFFIDGEKFPSTYGTGSEDYFGYAWSDWHLFENCYHNQPISEYNQGHTSVNRWQITDNVPFQKSFEGCIEKYYPNDRPTLYACVAYWYQAQGQADPYQPVPVDERVDFYVPLSYPLDVAGMLVLEEPVGNLEAQGMGGFTADKWSNNQQLWWTAEPGAKLDIGINVEKDGDYKILTRLTKARDYGIIQFYLDGQKVLEPMDLYYPDNVIATDEIELGLFKLSKGQHKLTVEVVGTNPEAIKRYMVGIDYIKVQKD